MVSDAFRWHTRQNEGVTGTYRVISWSANFHWWILRVQSGSAGERYFSAAWKSYRLTWLRSTMTQEGFSKLTVLNSHKERTAKFAHPLHPHFKRGGNWPPHFKNCSVGPAYTVYNCNLLLCLHKQTRNVYVVVDFFFISVNFYFCIVFGYDNIC